MEGGITAVGLFLIGGAVFFLLIWLAVPTSLRRRPNSDQDPHVINHGWGSGGGGGGGTGGIYTVPRDPQEYSKIWSDDRS